MNTVEQIKRLDEFATYKENWNSYGGKPIDPLAIFWAKAVLSRLGDGWTPVPCSDGSVQLEWHNAGVDMEMVISRY